MVEVALAVGGDSFGTSLSVPFKFLPGHNTQRDGLERDETDRPI
jgi:hypothetical protein